MGTRHNGLLVVVAALTTAGVGFAVGRATMHGDDVPHQRSTTAAAPTSPPPATLNGVTPPRPAPVDEQAQSGNNNDDSKDEIVGTIEVDRRVVASTRLVAATTHGLIELDLATGAVRDLPATGAGNNVTIAAGEDWVITNDAGLVAVQRDAGLTTLTGTYAHQVLWPPSSPRGWISTPSNTALTSTGWQQIDLTGGIVAQATIPESASVIGATDDGIVAGYRDSTYVFNGDGATWISSGEPIATNGTAVLMLRCERLTTCRLVVTHQARDEVTSAPIGDAVDTLGATAPGDMSLAPDSTRLLTRSIKPGQPADMAELSVIDLNSGTVRPVDVTAPVPLARQVAWVTSRHVVALVDGRPEVIDTDSGEHFALVVRSDTTVDQGRWLTVQVRP